MVDPGFFGLSDFFKLTFAHIFNMKTTDLTLFKPKCTLFSRPTPPNDSSSILSTEFCGA